VNLRRSYRFTLLALAVLGAVIGLFTGLQATRTVGAGPVRVSVGALVALVLTAGLGSLAAWTLRSRDAAFAPGAGWFVAVLGLLFAPHPGGDIVLPGDGADAVAFLLLGIAGTVLAGVVASRILPRRPTSRDETADHGSAGRPSPQRRHRR
jgi:hypothetical protein